MKKTLALLALASAMPLAAQSFEVGLFAGQQSYKDFSASNPLGSLSAKVDSKTVVAARFGYSIVDLGPALFQVTVGYQPEASATGRTTLTPQGLPSQVSTGDFKESNWSVGLMFNFKAVVAVGAGVEYRSEKLTDDNGSTTYGRPWARVNIGMAFPTPLVKPFIGIEASAPLASTSYNANATSFDEDNVRKSLAPKLQIGLYGGIRF